jgi:transposase
LLTKYFSEGEKDMKVSGYQKKLERRRQAAVMLVVKEKKATAEVGKEFKVGQRSVQKWVKRYREEGLKGIVATKIPGRPWKLTEKQKERFRKILLSGAQACGFSSDLWTCPRVSRMMAEKFGIQYHVHHIAKLLKSLGWSAQRPQHRAIERDEAKIKHWKRYVWREIKKKPKKRRLPSYL